MELGFFGMYIICDVAFLIIYIYIMMKLNALYDIGRSFMHNVLMYLTCVDMICCDIMTRYNLDSSNTVQLTELGYIRPIYH